MAGILDIGVSGLLSFQNSLNTTGHNIANADTEGYSRQRTLLSTQTPRMTSYGWIGNGVKVSGVERITDQFLSTQVRSAQSVASQLELYADYASRLDNVLADPDVGLDPALQDFFNAMQVVADDPASIPSRQVLLSESGSLVDRFHDLSRHFSDMRLQVNAQMESSTSEINDIAQSLGRLNQSIVEAVGATSGADPNDLMDQREQLLSELSRRVDIAVVPQDNGAWNVFIGKGQALIMGSNVATLSTRPTSSDVSEMDVEFTDTIGSRVITEQLSGGEIGGLIDFRNQILNPGQNQLGLVAIGIGERINDQQQLGMDLNGELGSRMFSSPEISSVPHSGNASSVTVSASIADSGNLTASDYKLESDGGDLYTLTRLSDNKTFLINTGDPSTLEVDGMTLTISGAATLGDKFYIQPTRNAADQISLQITDPRGFAAAAPLRVKQSTNADTGNLNSGSGVLNQPSVTSTASLLLSGPITLEWRADANDDGTADDPGFRVTGGPVGVTPIDYNPAADSAGKTFTDFAAFGGMSFSFSGVPAEGDRFIIENNTNGEGDNRNALAMAAIQQQNTLLGDASVVGGKETATIQEAYGQLVSDVGAKTRQANINSEASDGLLARHQTSLSSLSGVNLDEEAANLIRYQQAYQAAAQVITVANTVFDTLIGAIRR